MNWSCSCRLTPQLTAMPDPSRVCNLHPSSQQRQILNPLSKARDSWFLVGFLSTVPQRELLLFLIFRPHPQHFKVPGQGTELTPQPKSHCSVTPDPYLHRERTPQVLIKTWKEGFPPRPRPRRNSPYEVILGTPPAVKLHGTVSWGHLSRLKPLCPQTPQVAMEGRYACEPVAARRYRFQRQGPLTDEGKEAGRGAPMCHSGSCTRQVHTQTSG